MAYIRKTQDVYDIETNYGYGWEVETSEDNRKEAKQRYLEYLRNARELKGVRIVKRRIKIVKE